MTKTLLLAYASSQGATTSIAERMASHLRGTYPGLTVTLLALPPPAGSSPPSPGDFDALVVGSAIHAGSWLGPARTYLTHTVAPARKTTRPTMPVWAFSVGMPPGGEEGRAAEEAQVGKWVAKQTAVKGHVLFQGRMELEGMSWPLRTMFRWFGAKEEDRRDWNRVEEWADKVAGEVESL